LNPRWTFAPDAVEDTVDLRADQRARTQNDTPEATPATFRAHNAGDLARTETEIAVETFTRQPRDVQMVGAKTAVSSKFDNNLSC
jgi:hypothetical protein